MKYVKITKINTAFEPVVPTPQMSRYTPGQDNGNVSLPIDYWITGNLIDEPVIGKSLFVNRDCRNGVQMSGLFSTSTVTEITPTGFKTLNSEYILEELCV